MLFSIYSNGSDESPKWSIIDIYTMAQQSAITNLNYPLYHQMLKKDKWVSVTTAWNTFIDATVDDNNNYIYILDEGTGGGSFSTQAALWRDDVGALMLIIAENNYDERFPERSFLKAFQYMPISGDTTSLGIRLIPPPVQELSLLDFISGEMNSKDLQVLKEIHPTIYYKLPRKGTSIHALLVVDDELQTLSILKKCYNSKKVCEKKRKAYRYYYQYLKGKIYRDIELEWDDYQFIIKTKSKREPSLKDIWLNL